MPGLRSKRFECLPDLNVAELDSRAKLRLVTFSAFESSGDIIPDGLDDVEIGVNRGSGRVDFVAVEEVLCSLANFGENSTSHLALDGLVLVLLADALPGAVKIPSTQHDSQRSPGDIDFAGQLGRAPRSELLAKLMCDLRDGLARCARSCVGAVLSCGLAGRLRVTGASRSQVVDAQRVVDGGERA